MRTTNALFWSRGIVRPQCGQTCTRWASVLGTISQQPVAAWLPVDGFGKPLSGAIIYIEDMPPSLQAHFMTWLEQQPLSISRPPLGLPRRGQAYFAEDVLTAMDSAPR